MTPLQQAAWNKAIRDSVDALLHKGGYNEESSARHQLAMMNFDVESEQAQLVEPIGYVRHADKTFWPHPECAVYASVSPSLAPVYAHPAPPVDQAQAAAPVPMTDVEIYVVARNHPRIATLVPHIEVGQFARAIEKHHKIGAKP